MPRPKISKQYVKQLLDGLEETRSDIAEIITVLDEILSDEIQEENESREFILAYEHISVAMGGLKDARSSLGNAQEVLKGFWRMWWRTEE